MLTRSPVPAMSASASPSSFHAFHYAPTSSPHHSPRVSSAQRPRSTSRSPAASLTSPSHPRPKKYVSVDASTQYSPMESVDYTAKRATVPVNMIPTEPPPPPAPKPMVLASDKGEASSPAPEPVLATQRHLQRRLSDRPPSEEPQVARAVHPLSPNKRRNSQVVPGSSEAEPSASGTGLENTPKRPRPAIAPPKVLPQRYELCPVEDMVVLISNMLAELIETNDALALKSGHLTRFHSRTAPGISVLDYLHRLAKHATLTPPLLLSMVYYIDRLCALYPDFTINTLTVHRFLITAATVAAKGLSDSFWNNSTYARVGGVRVAELKLLELEFLYRVDWKIVPNPEVLVAYYRGLVERSPQYVLEDEVEGSTAVQEDEDDEDVEDDDVDEDESEEMDDSSAGAGEGPSPKTTS